MNISAPFIKRPVATTLLTAGVTLAGAIAFNVLPVSPLPQVDFPTISVSASLPGGSPEIMASSIATPLERQFGHIAGVTEMTSSSSLGSTSITLQFDLSRNIDGAARDVEAAINAARTYLPANLPANPTYRKVNPADAPIMILGLTSDKYDKPQLYDDASSIVAQKLSQIAGRGPGERGRRRRPIGARGGESHQAEQLWAHAAAVQSMLSQQNAHEATGQIADGNDTADIVTNDQMHQADDYKPLVIGYNNGAAVQLSDVADVVESRAEHSRRRATWTARPSITVIIFRQPGANIIETDDRIKAQLPSIEASIPQGIKFTVVLDRTTTIRASVNDVERSLIGSVILVVLVVFVFLRNWRATLIPSGSRSGFADRHVCRDVPAGLQPRQSLADGADHLNRICGGRCDCGDGEHLAASRRGHEPDESRVRGLEGDRVYHFLHQHVADRGLHSHSADGGNRRQAVPRVCDHAFDGDRHVHGGVADDHADDVRLRPSR